MRFPQQVFINMKEGLTTASVFGYPDPNIAYLLNPDTSDMDVGEVFVSGSG